VIGADRHREHSPASGPLAEAVEQGCGLLGLGRDPTRAGALAEFVTLLAKWNRVYNLTAVREPRDMVIRHVLDSLAVLPFLTSGRLLDTGTGAGLPGLPIALARPDLRVTLLDANAKKLRFVRQAVAELGPGNVEVVQQRMEQYRPAQAFDMVISRAVAGLADLYRRTAHLVRPGGRFLFMKGSYPYEELEAFDVAVQLNVERLNVPGLDAERHLVWFEKQQQNGALDQ
jgi:16S rRNA (guanine527-N7)-methyltransferase